MSLKIFHIADLHLGRTFRNLPEAQDTLSEARYETLQKTIDKANELETDIFVIAGDLFDRTSIKVGDIQKAVRAINQFAGEVVLVLPGNHDYITADSPLWDRFKKEAEEAEGKIKEWTEKYGSSDDVILELAETSKSIKDLKGDLDDLPSLPEGYESSGEFIKEVEQLDKDIQQLKEQIFEKKQERTQLEAEAPDTSSEELQKLRREAEAEFERINSRAETLAGVREKSLELIESMDSDTYKGLETGFVTWLERMVGKRFSAVDMDNDMPASFKTQDATSLTYSLLSHGTKDTVALAWRFALCEKFLTNGTGFIILDDPMVDIDPERRKEVVKAINQFSEKYQTIVMTCHPDHAEELGSEALVSLGQST